MENRPDGAPKLWGRLGITVTPGTLAYRIYGKRNIEEPFNCNYELNPDYRGRLEACGLKVSGVTGEGGVRIMELPGRRFFLATGFVPQLASEEGRPHPLITAFLIAAVEYKGDVLS